MLVHPENGKWIIVSDLHDVGGGGIRGTRQRTAPQQAYYYSWSTRDDWAASGGLKMTFGSREEAQQYLDEHRHELEEKLQRKAS
jgi:hypothetical protein